MEVNPQHPTVAEDSPKPHTYDTPRLSGYVFWHNRATDVVLIGPFLSVNLAWDWWNQHGQNLGVSPVLTHLRQPAETYNSMWGLIPEDQL